MGHVAMHVPQPTQRATNHFSLGAPGGRSNVRLDLSRTMNLATAPTANEPKPRTKLRRKVLIGCPRLEWRIPRIELISNANAMACSGQAASHLRQPMHSMGEFLIWDCPIGQAAEQASHLVQDSPTRR